LAGLRPDLPPIVFELGRNYAAWRYAGLELGDDEKMTLTRRLKRFRLRSVPTAG